MAGIRPQQTPWFEPELWRMPTVLETTLCVTLVGPRSMASLNCLTISGDDPLCEEAWTWQLARLDQAVAMSIAVLREELNRAIGSLSPF